MADEKQSAVEEVSRVLAQINSLWLEGRPYDLAPLFHDDIVMALPGFSGIYRGKTLMLAGFEDFCAHSSVQSLEVVDRSVDVVGDVAVATFKFDIVYERDGNKYRSTGRDFWVFQAHNGSWQAVWRTMLDIADEATS